MPSEIVSALREGRPLPDEKLNALLGFVRAVVKIRGWPGDEQISDFINAGYSQRHIFEVVLGVGMKTLSNYTNHIAATPLDEPFQPQAWSK